MKKFLKRFAKFVVAPLFVLVVLGVVSTLGYRAYRQSSIADARALSGPSAIDVLEAIEIGGDRQWIQIRGEDKTNPVLLYLHGGPGMSMMPFGYEFQDRWEEHFTVVHWDQRESGRSFKGTSTSEELTAEQYVADTLEVVDHLRNRFGQEKIVLLGHSWGTYLGIEAIRKKPEWFHAYVGVGQIVNMLENERATYEYTLEQAKSRGHAEALAELEALAPYPGEDMVNKIGVQRRRLVEFGGSFSEDTGASYMLATAFFSPDYSLGDFYRFGRAMFYVSELTLGELLQIDIEQRGHEYHVPIFIFSGRNDYQVPSTLNEAWFEKISAPHKEYVWFENSAHMAMIAEPDRFAEELVQRVLPFTLEKSGVEE